MRLDCAAGAAFLSDMFAALQRLTALGVMEATGFKEKFRERGESEEERD
jgi:hypothetical protein